LDPLLDQEKVTFEQFETVLDHVRGNVRFMANNGPLIEFMAGFSKVWFEWYLKITVQQAVKER
jgi:hypothetical protein